MSGADGVKAVFLDVVERPAAERRAALERLCGDDASLRRRVEELLAEHEGAGEFMGAPGSALEAARQGGMEGPGSRIGRYTLLEPLGEGGFGSVFLAEQHEPVRRRVAVKVIKPGMDTKAVIGRFEAERQALAMMDHPHIARVLDAGATGTGRPYFVMELVQGESIRDYCDGHRLSVPQRLDLFVQVCRAVQHAHTKGVIHRDLKPSNVMVAEVDGKPAPRVIDFGVAKAIRGRFTDRTAATELRQLVGTPEYMSPEQAAGSEDIDTRSDVYSLGVLLYELLTGVGPFDAARLRSASWDEMIRIIREEEPTRPSTRLSTMDGKAADVHERAETGRLVRVLRGDLDWIVMRCLEKERTRRYETASALSADIERHLHHEPVLAGPPSPAYRVRKFVRRNRVWVVAGVLIGAAMSVGLAGSTAGLFWALRERSRAGGEAVKARLAEADQTRERLRAQGQEALARQEAERADAVLDLVQGMLGSADPHATKGSGYTLKSLLTDYDRTLESDPPRQPLVEAALQATMGWAYRGIGDAARAGRHLERALSVRREHLAADHPDIAETLWGLGLVLHDSDDFAGAERALDEAVRMLRRTEPDGEVIGKALCARSDVLRHLGRYDEAEADGRESLRVARTLYGAEHARVADALGNLGQVLHARGDSRGAEALILESLAMTRKVKGDANPTIAVRLTNLASVLRERGDEAGAVPLLREALVIDRAALGEDHAEVATDKTNLAILLSRAGQRDEAEPLLREALALRRALFGDEDLKTANTMNSLGQLLRETGRQAEAEPLLRDSLALRRRLLGEEHHDVLMSKVNMAYLLRDLDNRDGAEALFREVLATRRKVLPADHLDIAQSLVNVGRCLLERGDDAGSEPFFREALPIIEMRRPAGHASVARVRMWLGRALLGIASDVSLPTAERIGRIREAEPLLNTAHASITRLPLAERGDLRDAVADLAALYELRHTLEPDQGFGIKAAEWRGTLDALGGGEAPQGRP